MSVERTLPAPRWPTRRSHIGPFGFGAIAFVALMGLYLGVLTLVSGWSFTVSQLVQYWYYILPLAVGFAVQVGMFVRLRALVRSGAGTKSVMAASGTTSATAMVSCCAHYLVNLAPILGAAGLVTFVSQYQIEFFWVGLASNAAGILYIGSRLASGLKEHAKCASA